MKNIYLDVCTFCRPYDNQSAVRVRMETDAYYLILGSIEKGRYCAIVSSVHFKEVEDIEDSVERVEILRLLHRIQTRFDYDTLSVRGRAEELAKMRFGVADAAHIAFAEATAEVFISCDDVLVGRCRRKGIRVQAVNPLEFVLQEGLR